MRAAPRARARDATPPDDGPEFALSDADFARVAERIRALGALAPGGLGNLAKMAGIKEIEENTAADAMVEHLVQVNKKLVSNLEKARDAAADTGDAETEDLMIARIQVHEKTIWMLKSFLEA